jgi:TonB family protein
MFARIILFFITFAMATTFQAASYAEEPKGLAVYAPKPDYPSLSNGQLPEGSGIFLLHVNTKTGKVRFVSIEKSTGSKVLDKAAIDSFKQWKFTNAAPVVKVPITFTRTGATY